MGLIVPQYEPGITILSSVSVVTTKTTSILKLGLPSDEDSESNVGVQFHFQITPTGGTTDSGMTVDFFLSYDGTTVDDVIGPAQVAFAAADIGGSPNVYHHTLNYETKNLGSAVQVLLTKVGGDRTLTAVVTAARWRWKHVRG